MKRRIGPAWLDDSEAGQARRRGRVKPGFFDEHAAIVEMDKLVRTAEASLAEQEADAERGANMPATFRHVADAYLDWLTRVGEAKPATLRDHRYLLAQPGEPYRRGPGQHEGLIMKALGGRPAMDITTREINQLLDEIASTGISARTVNKHRRLICAIFNYGTSAATFDLDANPATDADRRREPEPARLNYYSPLEVEALAKALQSGLHRDPDASEPTPEEAEARAAADAQDAELVRIAAFTSLRRGELMALRWRDVELTQRKVVVRRAVSGSEEVASTKSRRSREVPIPAQAESAFRRLAARPDFVTSNDYVFVSRLGRRLDGSAVSRRFRKARDAAGLGKLRFHDLRHTYGSLLVAGGVDLASVKSSMGHSRITTTERYLHSRSASELADRFTKAFGATEPLPDDRSSRVAA